MRFALFLALILTSFIAPAASAENDTCFPVWTSLHTLNVLDVSQDQHLLFPLSSQNTEGLYETKVVLQADLDAASSTLAVSVHFDDSFSGVSLAYNLYSVLVLEGGEVAAYMDFTKSCTDPGAGIFPGRTIHLPAIPLKGKGREPLQFVVWGRL